MYNSGYSLLLRYPNRLYTFMLRKIVKFFKILIPVTLVLVILLSVIAKLKENEITDIAIQKLSESVKASMVIDNATFTLLRKFPYATVLLEGVWIGGADSLNVGDTLVSIQKVYVSVESKDLLKKKFDIVKVELDGVDFNYQVASNGISNIDFLLADSSSTSADTAKAAPNIDLRQLILKNINCFYNDSVRQIQANIRIPDIEVNGSINESQLIGNVRGVVELSNSNLKNTNLYLMDKLELMFDVHFANDTLAINSLLCGVEDALISAEGEVVFGDKIYTDLFVKGENILLENMKKYAPNKALKELGVKRVAGELRFMAKLEGEVSSELQPLINMEVYMADGTIAMDKVPPIHDLTFAANITNGKLRNTSTTKINCTELFFKTDSSSANVSFSLKNLNKVQYKAKVGASLNLAEIAGYIPDTVLNDIKGYADVKFETRGVQPDSVDFKFLDNVLDNSVAEIELSQVFVQLDSLLSFDSISTKIAYLPKQFFVEDTRCYMPEFGIMLNDAVVEAKLLGSLQTEMGIDVERLYLQSGQNSLSSSLQVASFDTLDYSMRGKLKADLASVNQFMPDSIVQTIGGKVFAFWESAGRLNADSLKSEIEELLFTQSTFNVTLDDVSIKAVDTLVNVSDLSAKIDYSGDRIFLANFDGEYQGAKFNFDSVEVLNFYKAFLKQEDVQLEVVGEFNFGSLNYSIAELYFKQDTGGERKDKGEKESLIEKNKFKTPSFSVKGRYSISDFTYKDSFFTEITGLMNLSDSLFLIDKFKVNGFDGSMETSVRYEYLKSGKRVFNMRNQIFNMDVQSLLRDFDGFGQTEISDENISGVISIPELNSRVEYIGDSMDVNSIRLRGTVKIENGGIYNYAPVVAIEQDLPGSGVNNLENLEFNTINSQIFIFKSKFYVPKTDIITNQFDASVLGIKTFGDDYSYHAEIFLSDFLTGKSDRQKRKQNARGDDGVELNRNGRLVRSYSENGKRKNGLDNKNDRNETKRAIKASEGMLKLKFIVVDYNTGVRER